MYSFQPSKHIKRAVVFGVVILLAPLLTTAQQADRRATVYTEADGLSSSIIRCVLQDSRGLLWIGTPGGLNLYDGYTFKSFRKNSADPNSLRGNFITKLLEDRFGDIWIGYLRGGVSCYNISTGVFRHYPLKLGSDTGHVKAPEVTMLFVGRNTGVWIGTAENGLYKLDKHTGRQLQYNLVDEKGAPLTSARDKMYNTVYAAYEDEAGKLWLATAAGLYEFNPLSGTMTPHRRLPMKGETRDREYYLCIGRKDNKLWMGAWTGGLAGYDLVTGQWNHFLFAPLSPTENIINDIQTGNGDSILFISNDRGLGYFNTASETFSFSTENGLLGAGDYKSIYTDKTGNVWITSDNGLVKIRKSSPRFLLSRLPAVLRTNGRFHNVNTFFENDRLLLLGTAYCDGLYVKDKLTRKEQVLAFQTLPGEETGLLVTDILEDSDGTIWVLTRDYIYYLDVQSMQLKKRAQPALLTNGKSNYLFRMQGGSDGRLWISSLRNGVFLYDKGSNVFTRHYTPESRAQDELIPTQYIRSLLHDGKGKIWLGGANGFLGSIDEQSGRVRSYLTYFPEKDVNINTVYDIARGREDTLWVGSDAGLMLYKWENGDLVLKAAYTSEDGIASEIVKSIAMAGDGSIWGITQTSLSRLNPCTGVVTNYGFNDGLQNPGIGERLQALDNGKMALSTMTGYYPFDPVQIAGIQTPTPILVTSFAVNGQQRNYTNELAKKGFVYLEPSENRFSFEFASINFNNSGQQQYAYMLEGLDTGWTNAYNRYAGYANLQPGNYIFKVRAIGGIHQHDSETIAIPLQAAGYFYKSATFRILAVTLLLAAVYLVYMIRLGHQRRLFRLQARTNLLEKEKAMIMYENLRQQLNPHFLFNSLTSLSSLIRVNQKLAGEFLDGLSNTYRYILNSRDKELVSLSEEIRFCEVYVLLQKTRFRHALQVSFHIKEEHLHLKLPAVTLQNMIENALKHNVVTEEEPLTITVYTSELAQVVIENNLNKKPFVETSNRKGLASLRALYSYLSDKTIEVTETEERFIVAIPLI